MLEIIKLDTVHKPLCNPTNKEIRIMLEEDAFFDGRSVTYLDGRQTEFHLIHSDENQ